LNYARKSQFVRILTAICLSHHSPACRGLQPSRNGRGAGGSHVRRSISEALTKYQPPIWIRLLYQYLTFQVQVPGECAKGRNLI